MVSVRSVSRGYTESLTELFREFYSVISVEELPNRNCFGIHSVIFLCVTEWILTQPCVGRLSCNLIHQILQALANFQGHASPFSGHGSHFKKSFSDLGVMLGQGCLRALFGKQFPPPLKWVKNGFGQCPEMGPKWVQKWVLTHFDPLLHPKTHF